LREHINMTRGTRKREIVKKEEERGKLRDTGD
jgi:hypothetical protein